MMPLSDMTIDVLMATYNGATFLREQLDSLLAQRDVNFRIIVRDDGSSDATLSILHEYADENPDFFIFLDSHERLGPAGSFGALMQASTAPYIAFCDQDDVWEANKLALLMERMLAAEEGGSIPCIVHCDLRVVDANLNEMSPSFWHYSGIAATRNRFEDLLFQNTVTGCAALCNRQLVVVALPIPHGAIMHDHWLALCAAAFGRIVVEPKSLVRYRQHGRNSIGAKLGSHGLLIVRFFKLIHSGGWQHDWAEKLRQPRLFWEVYQERLSPSVRSSLQDLLAVPAGNAFRRRWLLMRHWMAPGGLLRKLVFWMRA